MRVRLVTCKAANALIAIVALAIILLTPASATGAGDAVDLAFTPHPGARLPLGSKLVDERGRTVELGEYFTNVPVVVVLEYLRCTSLCGVTLRTLAAEVLHALPLLAGRDYRLLGISIDPRDTPAEAADAEAKYAGMLGSNDHGGLHFLTSTSPDAVREIAETIGFPYRYDDLLDAYIHPAGFVVATPSGDVSRYIEGAAVSPREMIAALGEAQQNKAQAPLTRLLLLCRVQGAPLGSFSAAVLASFIAANLAAGLTLCVIFALIARRRHG